MLGVFGALVPKRDMELELPSVTWWTTSRKGHQRQGKGFEGQVKGPLERPTNINAPEEGNRGMNPEASGGSKAQCY